MRARTCKKRITGKQPLFRQLKPNHDNLLICSYLLIKVAAGRSHFAVVNVEKELYTWAVSLEGNKYIFRKKGTVLSYAYVFVCYVEGYSGNEPNGWTTWPQF